jgi:hypothetical protein
VIGELQNRIIGIAGRKGSGKSTVARLIMERAPRLFVFDTVSDHRWVPNTFDDLNTADQFLAWAEGQEFFAGRYIPESNLEQDFEKCSDLVWDQGDLLFGVEEMPMLCSPSYLPPAFDRIIRLGRHRKISVLWTAQRMSEVARRLTAATDVFILFAHTEPRDLDAIADRAGNAIAEKVANLGQHGLLIWDVLTRRELPIRDLDTLGRMAFADVSDGTR